MKKKQFIKRMIDLKMLITHHTDAIFCEKGMKHRVSDAVFGCCNPEAEKTAQPPSVLGGCAERFQAISHI